MNRWWRAYEEAVDDPKLLLLSDRAHRSWFNLMCLASIGGGRLPERKVIELKLRLSAGKTEAVLKELIQAKLVEEDETGLFPHNWNGRQYKSDVSTERVKRFRNKDRNVSETPPENREQNTDSEREEKKERSQGSRGASLPDDWHPSDDDRLYGRSLGLSEQQISAAGEDMRLWAKGNSNRSIGRKADWSATFKGWMRRNCKQGKTHGTAAPNGLSVALRQLREDLGSTGRSEAGGIPPPRLLSHG